MTGLAPVQEGEMAVELVEKLLPDIFAAKKTKHVESFIVTNTLYLIKLSELISITSAHLVMATAITTDFTVFAPISDP